MGFKQREKENDFYKHGPKNLIQIDWAKLEDQRVVNACLVRAVYVLRDDIKEKRVEGESLETGLACPWWTGMRFKKPTVISDASKVFGCIFEFDPSKSQSKGDMSLDKAPEYVVALYFQMLGRNNRVETAFKQVNPMVPDPDDKKQGGNCNIWLTGHSLGASIATYVGMKIVDEKKTYLETFLFNPPYLRLDSKTFKNKKVNSAVEAIQRFVANIVPGYLREHRGDDPHSNLKEWVPNLFLHSQDWISNGFIKYFENREFFRGMRPGNVFRVQKNGLFMDLEWTWGNTDDCPVCFIQSAKVFSNIAPGEEKGGLFKFLTRIGSAHQLKQWWGENLELDCKEYIQGQSSGSGN